MPPATSRCRSPPRGDQRSAYPEVMAEYTAPLGDMRFVLEHLVDLESIAALPGFDHVDPDSVFSVLEENARFLEDLVAPLNRVGDVQGSVLNDDGSVTTPEGFVAAYKAY